MNPIAIYDTTLRDGTQGMGVSPSVEDKLRIALELDRLGIDYIEGGWPGSNPKDVEFFTRVRGYNLQYARVSAFGSTCKKDVKAENDPNLQSLVEAQTPVIAIVGKSSIDHVKYALGTTDNENLRMVSDSVSYLKSQTGAEIVFDAEHFFDGFNLDKEYALSVLRHAKSAGADWLVLCDTNGGTNYQKVHNIAREVRQRFPHVKMGIHAHNDTGYAVANSMATVYEGAEMVQGTVNGIGERVGNADLVTILGNLFKEGIPTRGNFDVSQLTQLSRFVYEQLNLPPNVRQPYVGEAAFAHKGGIHVDAVSKRSRLYEHVNPELVGNQREFLVSDLAGTAHLAALKKYGLSKKDHLTARVLQEIKRLEHHGYVFEAAPASLDLLVRRKKRENTEIFRLLEYRVEVAKAGTNEPTSTATLTLEVDGRQYGATEHGNGPVNALDRALRTALNGIYPELSEMKLLDYKVRIIEGSDGTASKVRVLIESKRGSHNFGTVGVHSNIVEASWLALVESLAYTHLMRSTH